MTASDSHCQRVSTSAKRGNGIVAWGVDGTDDIDVSSRMSIVEEVMTSLEGYPLMLTIEEASRALRIGRSLAYELARQYEASDGHHGLPVMRLGSCMRVPRWALAELMSTGRAVQLTEAPGT